MPKVLTKEKEQDGGQGFSEFPAMLGGIFSEFRAVYWIGEVQLKPIGLRGGVPLLGGILQSKTGLKSAVAGGRIGLEDRTRVGWRGLDDY